MKLGKTAIAEIVGIVAHGIANGVDISEGIRNIDLGPAHGWALTSAFPDVLELTQEYVNDHPRASDWDETGPN